MNDKTDQRLIEVAFPLRETSIDSVHEKNVRHGHISTLHIWPARRPLAACRAALIATLLPDPGDDDARRALLKRLGGTLKKVTKKKVLPNGRVEEIDAWETEGGVLHWGRESGADMDWFRTEIKKAYGGRAPRVLDPFAGGGAIPLEAMRLGCEVTAADINPVAWFILKCTLEYPQRLAGQTRRLPEFALADREFVAAYLKAKGVSAAAIKRHLASLATRPQPLTPTPPPQGEGLFPPSPCGGGAGGEGSQPPSPPGRGAGGEGNKRPHLPPELLEHARDLRQHATDAEQLVWSLLRNRRLANAKFRRQHPLERYILDFYCAEHRLAIELDGGQHGDQQAYDAKRDAFLRERGITVLRFWNNDVLANTEGVLQRIWEHVAGAEPSPQPLSQRERGSSPPPPSGEGALHSPRPPGEGPGVRVLERGETPDLFGFPDLPPETFDADLAWHVRAWGRWVLKEARRELARFYPTYAEYCTLKPYRVVPLDHAEPLKLVPLNDAGEPLIDLLNVGFDTADLDNPAHPRWVAKPTVAYLWARTVRCKACRATLPLLKTRWLAKKDNKRVRLLLEVAGGDLRGVADPKTLTPTPPPQGEGLLLPSPCGGGAGGEGSSLPSPFGRGAGGEGSSLPSPFGRGAGGEGLRFAIDHNVPIKGTTASQRREHDKALGAGTMSRAGAACPCCGTIMTMEDLRLEGRAGRLGAVMTAVVVDGPQGKEYRLPTAHEIAMAEAAAGELERVFAEVPFGLPTEPIPLGASREGGGSAFTLPLYGFSDWHEIFAPRQLAAMGCFVTAIRKARATLADDLQDRRLVAGLSAFLQCGFDRMLDFNSSIVAWITSVEAIGHTFARFALPMNWDFSEAAPINDVRGGWWMCLDAVAESIETISRARNMIAPVPVVLNRSALECPNPGAFDVIITDPPYYDAIPYSDLMDYFHIWDRRQLADLSEGYRVAFSAPLGPKWKRDANDGELIDDASRFGGDREASKKNYEHGMAQSFKACHTALSDNGRLAIVFAHKQPDAWETLVTAIIKAGFVVDGSWPIQTEQAARMRAQGSAALASSVWLVCKKRDPAARPGWDTAVLKDMEINIVAKLRDFWDAGIRGPDFVWAATGPALEAYSRYPVVKKAAESGAVMAVGEFLGHVRRIVVDFVVGRVLSRGPDGAAAELEPGAHPLDDVTTYYLLHRSDFGLKEAPAGPCILYAISCGLSERELVDQVGLLARGNASTADDDDDLDADTPAADSGGSGGKLKLKGWRARTQRGLGEEPVRGRPIPLIDHVHRLLQLWAAGDVLQVNAHLDRHGLRRGALFAQVLQALIEQSRSEGAADECAALERLANHVKGYGSAAQGALAFDD